MMELTDYNTPDWPAQPPLSALVNKVHHADALTLLRAMETASVDLIATDWPYNGVKDDAWDNQWATDDDFLKWMGEHLAEMKRVLKSNGSYYGFASPRMAARVEVLTAEYFNVLNRITWQKPRFSTKAEMFDKDMMRAYFPASEAIIFADQYGSDEHASGEAGYIAAEEALKQRIFGDYLLSEFIRANVSNREIAALFPSITGGLTGCVSNWLNGANVPTSDQYHKMRNYLNGKGGDYLRREYDYLRREYDYLRREYEDLRREYEDLRRPFTVSQFVPYTDVWTFATVGTYAGKHPCEKPLALMEHIVKASSREGDLVADFFVGSGAGLDAARINNRRYIGCDASAHWAAYSNNRLAQPYTPALFDLSA